MVSRKMLLLFAVMVSFGSTSVWAEQPYPSGSWASQDATSLVRYMTDMELIDDDSGWGVSANFLDDGKTFAGVTLYQFSDNQLVAVSELYTDAAEPAWLPTDLEMVGDRGWLGVITNVSAGESGAGRLIRVEAGSLSEVNVRAPQSTVVMGIDLLDADNGWAVGGVYDKDSNSVEMPRLTPVILKMENGSWFAVEAPMGDYFLMDVEMIAPNEAWAVGASGDINLGNTPNDVTGVFLHYLDGVWTVAQDFPQMAAADIEFFDQANGWAVGANENDTVAMFRFQNGVWELAPVVMPADYDVHISGADLYSNFELTGRDSGLVSSLYPEIMLPDRTNPSLLQLQSGSQWQGVVLPNIQSGFSFGTFVAVSPSRNRVIAGLIDTCMSGYCLVTYELEEDGTWRELSIYP